MKNYFCLKVANNLQIKLLKKIDYNISLAFENL